MANWFSRVRYEGRHNLKPARSEIGSHRTRVATVMGPQRGKLLGTGLWYGDVWRGGTTTKKPTPKPVGIKFPSKVYGRKPFNFDVFPRSLRSWT